VWIFLTRDSYKRRAQLARQTRAQLLSAGHSYAYLKVALGNRSLPTFSHLDEGIDEKDNWAVLYSGGCIAPAVNWLALLIKGKQHTVQDNASTWRVNATIDQSQFKGTATLQSPPGVNKCTITDKDTRNNSGACPLSVNEAKPKRRLNPYPEPAGE